MTRRYPAVQQVTFGLTPPLPRRRFARAADPIRLRGQYPLVRDGADTCWAQIVRLGEFKGHWSGKPFSLTRETFASFIRNFEAQANAVPVMYGHPTSDGTPAAGWIHSMAVRGDWLCAQVEWTDKAADAIRAGEYKFTSIVFDTEVPNRVSGEDQGPTLFELGLVGTPFIDGQEPLFLPPRK